MPPKILPLKYIQAFYSLDFRFLISFIMLAKITQYQRSARANKAYLAPKSHQQLAQQ